MMEIHTPYLLHKFITQSCHHHISGSIQSTHHMIGHSKRSAHACKMTSCSGYRVSRTTRMHQEIGGSYRHCGKAYGRYDWVMAGIRNKTPYQFTPSETQCGTKDYWSQILVATSVLTELQMETISNGHKVWIKKLETCPLSIFWSVTTPFCLNKSKTRSSDHRWNRNSPIMYGSSASHTSHVVISHHHLPQPSVTITNKIQTTPSQLAQRY